MGILSGISRVLSGGITKGITNKILDPLGLFKKRAPSAARVAAEKATADAQALANAELKKTQDAQAQYQQAMLNMQKNSAELQASNSSSLDTETISNVVAGGSADAVDPKKRKSIGAGISSQLGINV